MRSKHTFLFFLFFTGATVFSIEAARAKNWKISSEASFVNTTGNTRTETFGSKNKYNQDWQKTALEVVANALASREERNTTAERYEAAEKMSWKFEKPNYLFELGKWEKDRFAGFNNRLTLGAGFGRRLLQTKRHSLDAELGGQQSWEDRIEQPHKKFGSLRAFANYLALLSQTAQFRQTVEYIRDFDQSGGFRINTSSALKAKISTHLSMQTSYEIKFDNAPVEGFHKTDTLTSVSLVVDL